MVCSSSTWRAFMLQKVAGRRKSLQASHLEPQLLSAFWYCGGAVWNDYSTRQAATLHFGRTAGSVIAPVTLQSRGGSGKRGGFSLFPTLRPFPSVRSQSVHLVVSRPAIAPCHPRALWAASSGTTVSVRIKAKQGSPAFREAPTAIPRP